MTTKTKAFETKDALDLYKKIIYTEGKAGRRMDKKQIEEMIDLAVRQLDKTAGLFLCAIFTFSCGSGTSGKEWHVLYRM